MVKSDLVYFIESEWLIKSYKPPHNPDCKWVVNDENMSISYPKMNTTVWIPRDFDGDLEKIVFSVYHKYPEKKVFWYINNQFLGETVNYHTFATTLAEGEHELFVIDETGAKQMVKFSVIVKGVD